MKYSLILFIVPLFILSCNNNTLKKDLQKKILYSKNTDSMNSEQLEKYFICDFDSVRMKYHVPIGAKNYYKEPNSINWQNPDITTMPRVEIIATFLDYKQKKFYQDITTFKIDSSSRLSISFNYIDTIKDYKVVTTIIKEIGQSPNIKNQEVFLSDVQYDSIIKRYNDTLLNYKLY